MEQIQNKFLRWIDELRQPFFSNQSNKIIKDENALYYVLFSIALKTGYCIYDGLQMPGIYVKLFEMAKFWNDISIFKISLVDL